MFAQIKKSKENKYTPAANTVGQKKSYGKQGIGLVDNRPTTKKMKDYQKMSQNSFAHNNNSRARKSNSPDTVQKSKDSPIQRYVFIDEEPLEAEEHDGTETEGNWIADDTVRDYLSKQEFSSHAAGNKDYIGNLPEPSEGTWVRFEHDGTNVIGENHTEVVLNHVLGAVGSKDFIHERFLDIADTADQVPETFQVYTSDTTALNEEYGVEDVIDKRKYAAETLVPKLGFGAQYLAYLLDYSLEDLRSSDNGGPTPDHKGTVTLKLLRQMWSYAEDIVHWFGPDYAELPNTELLKWVKKLIPYYLLIKNTVDPFVSHLIYGEALGDSLDTSKYRALAPVIKKFSQLMGDTIYIQALEYEDSGVTGDREAMLDEGASAKKNLEKMAILNQWRNKRFKELVTLAINKRTRYAGMGAKHLKYLLTQDMPDGMNSFNLSSADVEGAPSLISGFEDKTEELRQKVE